MGPWPLLQRLLQHSFAVCGVCGDYLTRVDRDRLFFVCPCSGDKTPSGMDGESSRLSLRRGELSSATANLWTVIRNSPVDALAPPLPWGFASRYVVGESRLQPMLRQYSPEGFHVSSLGDSQLTSEAQVVTLLV